MIENLFWLGFVGAALALVFALIQRNKVMAYSEGTDTMKKIAQSIRDGANAYLKHQYTTVAKVFVVVFIVLLIMAFATGGEMLSKFTPFAFLVRRNIRALARAIAAGRPAELAVTMPLSPRSFVRASTRYWTQMGAANGCTPEQMASMDIEPQP